jgi:hypothetical protein
VCHLPCAYPRPDNSTVRIAVHDNRPTAFCSEACQTIFVHEPGRYLGAATFDAIWHGTTIEEFVVKNGLVRADGTTLVAQPHLEDEHMWTLQDIRRVDCAIEDPLRALTSAQAAG